MVKGPVDREMSEQKKSIAKRPAQHRSRDKDQDQQTEEDGVVDMPADFDELFKSERVKKLFNKMLDQKVEAKLKQHRLAGKGDVVESLSMRKSKQGAVLQNRQVSPMIKSPSDTTIYTPAFLWFKFTPKPPNSIMHGNFFLAICDTSHWNFFVKFGLKTPYDIS